MQYRDGDWLREKYLEEELTQSEIADQCGVSKSTIVRWMDRHGIDTRDRSDYVEGGRYRDPEWLSEKYHDEKMSQREIAAKCDVSPATIHRWLKNHDIEVRSKSEALTGELHPFWGESLEFSEEHKENMSQCRMGEKHHFYGKSHSEESRQKISEALQGRTPTESQLRPLREQRQYIKENGHDATTLEKLSEALSGENSPVWKGGYDCYSSQLWDQQRERALERAEYTCEKPGCEKGPDEIGFNPPVHHIVPARHFEEMSEAHDLDNLLVLCPSHHAKMDHRIRSIESTYEELQRTAV